MRKLHNRLKASAPKRRTATGRPNPQEGIIDSVVRKRKEAKVFEQIGRKMNEKRTRPQERTPMSGATLKSRDFTPDRVNQTERPQSIESMKAEGLAAQPKPAPTASNTKNRESQGPAQKTTPIKNNPAAETGFISNPAPVSKTDNNKKQYFPGQQPKNKNSTYIATNFGVKDIEVRKKDAEVGGKIMAETVAMGVGAGLLSRAKALYNTYKGGRALVGEVGGGAITAGSKKGGQTAMREVFSPSSNLRQIPQTASRGKNFDLIPRPKPQGLPSTRGPKARSWSGTQTKPPGTNTVMNSQPRSVGTSQAPVSRQISSTSSGKSTIQMGGRAADGSRITNSGTTLRSPNMNKLNEAARRGGKRVTGSDTAYPGVTKAKKLPAGAKSYPKPANTIGKNSNTWW